MAEITLKTAEARGIRAPATVYDAWDALKEYATTTFGGQMIQWNELAFIADHL